MEFLQVDSGIIIYILLGFAAQMIDGALGMAYGVSLTTMLLTAGVTPAVASASVHIAEMFTTFVSGIFHFKLGNVDKALFKKLVIPGVIGGAIGAYILTSAPGDLIAPFISFYLLLMGIRIIYKVHRKKEAGKLFKDSKIPYLAFVGGCMDAIGGGGWGPIVTTTLISDGNCPRTSVGTVNASEFYVTIAEVIVFITAIKILDFQLVLGLIIGGVIAAPLAAVVCKKMPTRWLMATVGTIIMLLSIRQLLLFLNAF
jgi:uncharacterized membrane protein YfcA